MIANSNLSSDETFALRCKFEQKSTNSCLIERHEIRFCHSLNNFFKIKDIYDYQQLQLSFQLKQ